MNKRGAFFKEPKRRSSEKQRFQRVRFRPRYASSVLKRTGVTILKISTVTLVLAGLGFGGYSLQKFWNNSSTLRISSVQFNGDVPPALRASFPLKPGDHLFQIELGKMEEDLKQKFPELNELSISRRFNGSLMVKGAYKKALALYETDGKPMGVADDGKLFPIGEHNAPPEKLPVLAGKMNLGMRVSLLNSLQIWKKDAPAFWTLVKRLETDSIGAVRATLEDGVVVQWGEMSESELLIDAANVLNVLDRFTPTKTPALLRVLSKNRVVMDSNWNQKKR